MRLRLLDNFFHYLYFRINSSEYELWCGSYFNVGENPSSLAHKFFIHHKPELWQTKPHARCWKYHIRDHPGRITISPTACFLTNNFLRSTALAELFERHYFKPRKKHHFDGNIYLLTGGNSFSATTLVLKALQGQSNVKNYW